MLSKDPHILTLMCHAHKAPVVRTGVPLGLEADSISALGDMQMATTAALMRTKYPASKLPSTISKQLQQVTIGFGLQMPHYLLAFGCK